MGELVGAEEVQKILRVGRSTAYVIIKMLNKELQEKGYCIIRGRVEKSYLLERFAILKRPPDIAGVSRKSC